MLVITKEKFKQFRESGSLATVLTVLGVFCGLILGISLKAAKDQWTPREIIYLRFPGELFLRALQALVLPLIVSSLIDAIGSLDLTYSKKIGLRAMAYYLTTTAIAAVLGIILTVSVQPGNRVDFGGPKCEAQNTSTVDTLLDLVRNVFPNNLVGATMEGTQTHVIPNDTLAFSDRKLEIINVPGTNMLGLVVFAMVMGVTLGMMKEAGKPVLMFFKSLGNATMLIISKVVSFSPVAICFLIAAQLVEQDDILSVFENIAWYFGTVVSGLFIHGFIILPLSYLVLTRSSPIKFLMNMFQAMATAFGTASSSATLPVTLKCLEEKNKINVTVSRFVIPIGATVNMNGAALYLPVATIYIAQLCGQSLGAGSLISLSLVTIASSVGAAGVPHMAMVVLVTVLNSQGLPTEYVASIYPVEWLLDRLVTTINILGDAFGAAIVAKLSESDLQKKSIEDMNEQHPDFGVESASDYNSTIPHIKLGD